MVSYLEKSEGSEGFHEIIDFLSASHIHYALTTSPTIYTSLIEQFWQTIALCIIDDGVMGNTTTINRKVKITVSEASIRRNLKLEDSEGIPSLPTAEIFEQLALMGVHSLGRDEGSLQQNELMDLVTKLSERVTVLETGIQQTKKTYSTALFNNIERATTQRDTGSYYPKRYWELLTKEILGAITQRDTGMTYGKNGGNLGNNISG
ncbi:hypothetical protein Tco_1172830 [Tanacetum coccineum]